MTIESTNRRCVLSDVFDHISALDNKLHFCEDFAASGPLDRAQVPVQGPLAGRIVGLKANIRVAGQAWTAGIGARAGDIAVEDAPITGSLRAAGATLLSRLSMDEGALGAATDNPHFGRCDNPAVPGHSAGGSSGGPAAAVASGAVDAALGSDTMGSVRIPAAFCGVHGLKLGSATVDMSGVMPLAPELDALGIFARTPGLLEQVLDVLVPAAPAPEFAGWYCLPDARLGGCTPEIRRGYAAARRSLQDLMGPPAVLPQLDLPALRADTFLLTEAEAVVSLGDQPGLSPGLARLIDFGRKLTPEKMAGIRTRLEAARTALRGALGRDRVLLTPTVSHPPFPHGTRPPEGQADFTAIANVADLPALAVPIAGADHPISVQLVGPRDSERALLSLAAKI